MDEVRLLTRLNPLEYETIPSDRLPAGVVRVHLRPHGEFYARPGVLAGFRRPGFRHPRFPEPVRDLCRRFERVFRGVRPRTADEWEDGFRRDVHPWRELAHWEAYADAVERFAGPPGGPPDAARHVWDGIIEIESWPPHMRAAFQAGLVTPNPAGPLDPAVARAVMEWRLADETRRRIAARTEELRRLLQPGGPAGPDRLPIAALFDESGAGPNLSADFDPMDLVGAADVVLGVDVATGREVAVFGDPAAGPDGPGAARVLRVELDLGAGDLDRLSRFVAATKGLPVGGLN